MFLYIFLLLAAELDHFKNDTSYIVFHFCFQGYWNYRVLSEVGKQKRGPGKETIDDILGSELA